MENRTTTQEKPRHLIRKWDGERKRWSSEEEAQTRAIVHHTRHPGSGIKSVWKQPLTPVTMASIKETKANRAGQGVENTDAATHTASRNWNWGSLSGCQQEAPQNSYKRTAVSPSVYSRGAYTSEFAVALLTTAQKGNQPGCPPAHEWGQEIRSGNTSVVVENEMSRNV